MHGRCPLCELSAFSLDFFPRSVFLPGLLLLLALLTWSLWLGSGSSCWGSKQALGFRNDLRAWVHVPFLPPASCVTSNKLLSLYFLINKVKTVPALGLR